MLFHDTSAPEGCSTILMRYLVPDKLEIYSVAYSSLDPPNDGSDVSGVLILGCSGGHVIVFSVGGSEAKMTAEIVMLRKVQEHDIRSVDITTIYRDNVYNRTKAFRVLTTSFDQRCLIWTLELEGTQRVVCLAGLFKNAFYCLMFFPFR